MTIGLAMIVRDAEAVLERCLLSARPHIDSWTIVDTGSVDSTPEIVRETLGAEGLHFREWRNFGHNRTELMRLAKGTADYLLLLDADMVLHMPTAPALAADCYHGRIRGSSLDYTLPLLVKGDRNWSYEGVAHSYLACDGPYTEEELHGLAVDDYSSTGPEKLRRDLELLSAEHARNPLDARTAFYLAQTYYDLDMFPEAIAAYRARAHLDGWNEETYCAKLRLGELLCEHVSFSEGARALLDAWEFRPARIEALRILAAVAENVADKYPYPSDRLFVRKRHYKKPPPPPFPSLDAEKRRRPRRNREGALNVEDVSAVLVTRGNVDLQPILETLPYSEVVVWNNAERAIDYRAFGRYAAIPETTRPVIYWQDDDVIFTAHDELLAAYQPHRLVCNMDADWIDGAGYRGLVGMQGAGSLCDAALPAEVWAWYLQTHPWDDDALTEADFVFGTLVPFTVVDLGYQVRPFADDPDRLYTQPGQTKRKWETIGRCRALLETLRV